jgi:putative hydrolase of the HAD superfamily
MSTAHAIAIRAVTFDLGNVLVKVDHFRFCRRLGALAGVSPEKVYQDVFASGLEPGYDTGRITSQDFHRRVMAHFGLALPYPSFCDLWNDIFDPLHGMEEVVARMHARRPLFMLSNTNALHFPYIKAQFPDIFQYFREYLLSYEVGSRKPEPEIYQALIRRAGQRPEAILFLDDKPEFVAAARHHGLTAWQFTTPQELEQALKQHSLWE